MNIIYGKFSRIETDPYENRRPTGIISRYVYRVQGSMEFLQGFTAATTKYVVTMYTLISVAWVSAKKKFRNLRQLGIKWPPHQV